MKTTETSGLEKLREPFKLNQISKLPKPTRAQTEEVKKDYRKGIRCDICGKWHHPKVIHLDYVGHAALTDRLLDVDINWNWEPASVQENGLPVYDGIGGMWIKLTVCGVTRLGYGSAEGKKGGDAVKEVIGDALRNAAMRFGAALDLWHIGELHETEPEKKEEKQPIKAQLKERWNPTIDQLWQHYQNKDIEGCHEVTNELTPTEKSEVWSLLPGEVKAFLAENKEIK